MKQSGRLFQPEPRNSKAKLFSQVVVEAKHIHSNDFHSTSDDSIIFKKVISDDSLCSAFKNGDDIEIVKILRNETHLSLDKGILIPRHSLWKPRKIMLKVKVIGLANDKLKLKWLADEQCRS